MCDPYSVFNLATVENSPTADLVSIVVTFTHPSAIRSLIRYARIDQGGTLNWSVPVSVLPGQSPYTLAGLTDGQYRVGITPVYADGRLCSEITKDTAVCGTINAFSAALNGSGHIIVTYSATSAKVKVVINQPNGGVWSQIYTTGASIDITPAAGITGDFYVYMYPVCNANTAWIGPATAPAIITVTPANNSSIVNHSSRTLGSVYISATDVNGSRLVVLVPTLTALTGTAPFYLADGFYTEISITALSGSGYYTATLVTGSGSYPLVGGAFKNVTVVGGVVITLIDSSP